MFRLSARLRHLALAVFLASLVVLLAPAQIALARVDPDDVHVEVDRVVIDATLETDGTIDVVERRTFSGEFNGVYWNIPAGSFDGAEIETSVLSVGKIEGNSVEAFVGDGMGEDGHFETRDEGRRVVLKVYSETHNAATFEIHYRSTNVGRRWKDTAELYWQFVTQGWDCESKDVTCTVHIPVPAGTEVIPTENVRAWGHGPLDADVSIRDADIIYNVPGVGTREFAEARITFPGAWLSQVEPRDEARLQSILKEEQEWADEANARRERARLIGIGGVAVGVLGGIASLVVSISSLVRYRNRFKPQFDDTYFRDVPSDDHPAVLGALLEGGEPTTECLTASLMRLSDMRAIRLDPVKLEEKGLLGRKKKRDDYRVTCLRRVQLGERGIHAVDNMTQRIIFDDWARYTDKHGDPDGVAVLYFGDLDKVAKKYPQSYKNIYDKWVGCVQASTAQRCFFKADGATGRAACIIASVLSILISMLMIMLMIVGVVPILWALIGLVLSLAGGIVASVIAAKLKPLSREAIELLAKLKALKRWLKDFTRLEEAVPLDVILWNRLLVMAVVLGVADEVIKQLRTRYPQVLEQDGIYPTYVWYRTYHGGHSPASTFSRTVASAHSVSNAELAASSSSSGSGGGGGFSGGGGGGFGGGGSGGGGAF